MHAPPSNCDITKALWREHYSENGGLPYDENNWQLTLSLTTISLTPFWRTKAVVTSHFAAITLTDFLAKARLLDRNVNLMCQFNCIMAAFINKSSERCVLLVFGLFR